MSSSSDEESSSAPLTAAELLRRKSQQRDKEDVTLRKKDNTADIDDEIRRLEAELANGSEDDSSSGDSDDSDSEEDDDASGDCQGVLILSKVRDERIEKLPENLLPAQRKRTLRNIDGPAEGEPERTKKRTTKPEVSDGLTAAVKEVLAGYKPRSSEKLPFYCRVCAKQYENEEEFFEHKSLDFHKAAVDMEKKASFCKLCRKQLTSPAQLKEHLSSRPHKERLQTVRAKQQGRGRLTPSRHFSSGRGEPQRYGERRPPQRGGRSGGGRGGYFGGRGRSGSGRGQSQRQWS